MIFTLLCVASKGLCFIKPSEEPQSVKIKIWLNFISLSGIWTGRLKDCKPEQNIWNKVKKPNKIGHEQKTLVSSLIPLMPKFYVWKGDRVLGYISTTQFWDFPNISQVLSPYFGHSPGHSTRHSVARKATFKKSFLCQILGSLSLVINQTCFKN